MTDAFPTPEVTEISRPYWSALEAGRLAFQQCSCGHRWLPPRRECPACLGTNWSWVDAAGRGRIVSWVVYHVAYHDAFKDALPYNVAVIELLEGPRLISNVLNCREGIGLTDSAAVELAITRERGQALATFRLVGTASARG